MANQFNNVSKLRPGRSVFNLSYEKKFNCDMGMLIPILHDFMQPGAKFKMGSEVVVRWQPLIKPIIHEVDVFTHYFFVPYRLLWDEWERFITGGPQGPSEDVVEPSIPLWEGDTSVTDIGTLWDYMGLPIGVTASEANGNAPHSFARAAYNLIYNEYYRDQTLQEEISLDSNLIQFRAWMKDYFTSALPWQQRSEIVPSLPIAGTTSAQWPLSSDAYAVSGLDIDIDANNDMTTALDSAGMTAVNAMFNNNNVDLSLASTFDIADLRYVVQLQKFLERNARVGARYTEFLSAHFGVSPRDSRLDRPEFCGGSRSPVIISEVLQTGPSSSDLQQWDTPQGNLAGHGITADRSFAGTYRAEEFGIMMGIMSIMPKPAYQQGINKQWLYKTKYDFPFPEFAHLSEQGIEQKELYANDVLADNNRLFGYQGRNDELRVKQNLICGTMRSTAPVSLDYWHLARNFETSPILDETFIKTGDATKVTGLQPSGTYIRKDIFAVQDEYTLIVNFGNIIKGILPIPAQSNPGLMDHF